MTDHDADPLREPIPMFPLGSVLFPGGLLPLHVFEPRYRQLVEDCLTADPPEFGVTLIARGSEVGGGDHRTDVGTIARMVQVGRLADGRYAVIAIGHRRIRVTDWWSDAPYPRATVVDWPDDTPDDTADDTRIGTVVDDLARRIRRTRALAVEVGDLAADLAGDEPALPDDPSLASFLLADRAPLGPVDRQELLAAAGPMARLEHLSLRLDEVDELLRFRLGGA